MHQMGGTFLCKPPDQVQRLLDKAWFRVSQTSQPWVSCSCVLPVNLSLFGEVLPQLPSSLPDDFWGFARKTDRWKQPVVWWLSLVWEGEGSQGSENLNYCWSSSHAKGKPLRLGAGERPTPHKGNCWRKCCNKHISGNSALLIVCFVWCVCCLYNPVFLVSSTYGLYLTLAYP